MSLKPIALARRSTLGLGRWTPHTIPNLQWAYEFWRQGTGAIAAAVDISGRGRHATEATEPNQPVNTAASIDGLNAAVFVGASSQRLTATGWTVVQPASMVVVAKYDSLPAGGSILADGASSASTRNTLYQLSSVDRAYAGAGPLTGTSSGTTWQIRAATFNGASSKLWRGGGTASTGNPGTQSMSGVKLGAAYDNTLPLTGVILAAYYWSGIVSTADLDLLAAYLQGFAPSLPWSPAL